MKYLELNNAIDIIKWAEEQGHIKGDTDLIIETFEKEAIEK